VLGTFPSLNLGGAFLYVNIPLFQPLGLLLRESKAVIFLDM